MAEAVLEIVLQNLGSLLQKEVALFRGFDQDFKSLSSMLTTIKAVLEDAEEKQFSDRSIKDWLQKLKDAAYVLDDILDECATQALEEEYQGSSLKVLHTTWLSSFHPKHAAFRYKIAKKMKKIKERFDEIAKERNNFHLTEIVRDRMNIGGVLDWRQTTSFVTQPKVYGRDEDKNKIIDFLVGDKATASSRDLVVCPIVGLGGLGKTTLAQLIFNHARVINHFELRIWVCVSEDFSLKRMTKAIIESASGHACQDLDLEPLQRKLIDLLQSKRYLLVLDDVWDYQQENWQRLRSVLACGGNGASVLVTTRLPKVAETMGTMRAYDLSLLSYSDCWELFEQRAFGPNEEKRAELVVIGKEIVKKCGGVPLAAIALGALLRFKREANEWFYVKKSKLWSLSGENVVMPALRLSYLNLPVKLRQCFAFCAIFPKDEIIKKQYLIELWMANGMISSNGMFEAEDIGNDVWNELYWRAFFQDIERDELHKITSFKMHDLVHDLAESVAVDICCITNDNGSSVTSESIRHLSFYKSRSLGEDHIPIMLHQVKSLKTCITIHRYELPQPIWKCYSLRVFEFFYANELPSSIGFLKHLRYLNLSWGLFKVLPESVCTLWNLHTLKLNFCVSLQKLPNSLIRMKSLEHIYLYGCRSLSSLPPQIRMLASLKTLTLFVVGKKRGFLLAELGHLNLKGHLNIEHLERVKSISDAKDANMLSKHVSNLQLTWAENEEAQLQKNVEEIFEVLQPHTQQLQTLSVLGYTGAYFPQWMCSPSLECLTCLELGSCQSCLYLPDIGKLPSLKRLNVSGMRHIKYLHDESCNDCGVGGCFPKLEFLVLEYLPELISLSREDRENMFPHLKILHVHSCQKYNFNLSADFQYLTCLEELDIRSCPKVEAFSEALQHMAALQSLTLCNLPKLVSLPDRLGSLGLLHTIRIYRCPKVLCLPTSIQCLTSLKNLKIVCCSSELGKRCQGEDWPNIAHVQSLLIDNATGFPAYCRPSNTMDFF